MSSAQIRVFLIPGFLGFKALGNINYFQGVRSIFNQMLKQRKLNATIIECKTQPTGSLKARADFLLNEILDQGADEAESISFIGHSTGGLDIRLLLTPGVQLTDRSKTEQIAKKTRSVITIATPHYGTPLAGFFTTFQGRHLLQLLAVMANSKGGRKGIFWSSKLISLVARLDDSLGRTDTFLDKLSNKLLRQLTLDPNDEFWRYLDELSRDQGAILQLTAEAMDLFQSAVTDREGISYCSILTVTPKPFSKRPQNIASPSRIAMWAVFMLLYRIVSKQNRHYPYPHLSEEVDKFVKKSLPFSVDSRSNDGVVPLLSQVHGKVIGAYVADHLDVVGQFFLRKSQDHTDWLPSGSHFGPKQFESLWAAVAGEIAKSHLS